MVPVLMLGRDARTINWFLLTTYTFRLVYQV